MNEEIKEHLDKNILQLNEIFAQEQNEQKKIRENLKNFHEAADKRENEIKDSLNQNHEQRMKTLRKQAEFLKTIAHSK